MQFYESPIRQHLELCRAHLVKQHQTLSLAESCTGGWISKYITDQPGASTYYWGGVCSYANEAKAVLLGVPWEHLNQFGAVSEVVARDMAEGIRRVSGTNFGLAVTGIAGPDGGSAEKPVGLVYIAAAGKGTCQVKRCHFQGDRTEVRLQTAAAALKLLWELMQG